MRSNKFYLVTTVAASCLHIGRSFAIRSAGTLGLQARTRTLSEKRSVTLQSTEEKIVSPFDDSDGSAVQEKSPIKLGDNLDLTWENVEAVLDELRPYLIQDGGNVIITEIDGPIVKLELQVRSVFILGSHIILNFLLGTP